MSSDPVAHLWERFRPLVAQRLDLIEAFLDGNPRVQREEAQRAAHNLAGSLGSYGRPEGSELARRIDLALSSDPTDGPTDSDLQHLIRRLKEITEV
jgi:HPt (histidine-containing phosphotransfer) domain-containing protein